MSARCAVPTDRHQRRRAPHAVPPTSPGRGPEGADGDRRGPPGRSSSRATFAASARSTLVALPTSRRGGPSGFIQVLDDRRLVIADLGGNNRLDTIENIIATGQIGMLIIHPGRVRDRACQRPGVDHAVIRSCWPVSTAAHAHDRRSAWRWSAPSSTARRRSCAAACGIRTSGRRSTDAPDGADILACQIGRRVRRTGRPRRPRPRLRRGARPRAVLRLKPDPRRACPPVIGPRAPRPARRARRPRPHPRLTDRDGSAPAWRGPRRLRRLRSDRRQPPRRAPRRAAVPAPLPAGRAPPVPAGRRRHRHGRRPGGRSEERNLLDRETLRHNVDRIKAQLERLLDFEPGPHPGHGWSTTPTGPTPSACSSSSATSASTSRSTRCWPRTRCGTASRASTASRFTEFSYMLLQANDFRHLYEHHGVELQVGGSDQWGNIVAGVDLIRRRSGATAYGARPARC